MRWSTIALLILAIPIFSTQPSSAEEMAGKAGCCDLCGRQSVCYEKCCQIVCEMKKEKKTSWCVETSEICTLMPACHHDCDQCGPRCGRTRCVKKLVKKEYEVEKPVYKCVVRHLCADCCQNGTAAAAAPAPQKAPESAPQPPVPQVPTPAATPK